MADSPRGRSSRSPSPWQGNSRSRSRSRSRPRSGSKSRPRSPSRSRSRSGSHDRDAVNPGNTLYVTGLSTRVTERDLEDHFSREGKVNSCRLVVEPRTRISRGFAFVTMDNIEGADRCVKHLNQSVLEGRYITVEKVFDYSEDIASAMLAAIKDDEFIHLNFSHTGLISGQLNNFSHASDQLNIGNSPTTKQPQHSSSTLSSNQRTLPTLSNQAFMSRRKRPRTPTPGNYLGLKSSRDISYRGDRSRYRGGYGRDDYGYRRSPRRSPYHGGCDYSPRRSPYGGRSRRERSRSLPYSPYGSPERGYGRRANAYAR